MRNINLHDCLFVVDVAAADDDDEGREEWRERGAEGVQRQRCRQCDVAAAQTRMPTGPPLAHIHQPMVHFSTGLSVAVVNSTGGSSLWIRCVDSIGDSPIRG